VVFAAQEAVTTDWDNIFLREISLRYRELDEVRERTARAISAQLPRTYSSVAATTPSFAPCTNHAGRNGLSMWRKNDTSTLSASTRHCFGRNTRMDAR
jgi:hypothetical protein